jgi:ABC-type antimicrobial peptide transport system permease subunit
VRNVRRRSWSVVHAVIGIGLVVAFATELVVFKSTYNRTKTADSRFAVGSDIRITPLAEDGVLSSASLKDELKLAGVSVLTPVTFSLENSVLIGPYDQARTDLAAIDPASFLATAAFDKSTFEVSNDEAMQQLAQPGAAVISATRADDLSINVGDRVQVLLARGSKYQKLKSFKVVGLFTSFPGFPQGLDIVVNRSTYESATALDGVDFFLARTTDTSRSATVASQISLTIGDRHPLRVVASTGYLNKDQSSLTAVNIRGLLEMGLGFAIAIGICLILIVIFVQLMQRRREYVALRAFGMSTYSLMALILGESLFIVLNALIGGFAFGLVMARALVIVLRPIFLVAPKFDVPIRLLVGLGSGLVVSTFVFALIATAQMTRHRAIAVLREA